MLQSQKEEFFKGNLMLNTCADSHSCTTFLFAQDFLKSGCHPVIFIMQPLCKKKVHVECFWLWSNAVSRCGCADLKAVRLTDCFVVRHS